MIGAAGSCLLLLGGIFGLLTWVNRHEIREWWSDFLREVTQ